MKLLGIIAEYNPLHTGHAYHIKKSKHITGATHTIAVMSGSAVQRGGFALVDKWSRAAMALNAGVDLVVELPYAYAGQSAAYFAGGAVSILASTGICDFLSFGSEAGDLRDLIIVADCINAESESYRRVLKSVLDRGLSFAIARSHAVSAVLGERFAALLSSPNNILAIEYLKALRRQNTSIVPVTIPREGAGYHDVSSKSKYVSAAYLRQALITGSDHSKLADYLPYPIALLETALDKKHPHCEDALFRGIVHQLLTTSVDDLKDTPDMERGLEFRLKNAAETASDHRTFVESLASKRITTSRMQRIVMNMLMHFKAADLKAFSDLDFIPYLRVLGFNDKGREIIKTIKDHSAMPILTNLDTNRTKLDENQLHCLSFDLLATDLYALYCEKEYRCHQDFSHPVVQQEI